MLFATKKYVMAFPDLMTDLDTKTQETTLELTHRGCMSRKPQIHVAVLTSNLVFPHTNSQEPIFGSMYSPMFDRYM